MYLTICRSLNPDRTAFSLIEKINLTLDILFQDHSLVAINKPHDLLVHPSPIARDAEVFAMQMLRDQLGQHVYPAHRLDRKTGGVLLFGMNAEVNKELQMLFAERRIDKQYYAIVRGFCENEGEIDYPLRKDNGTMQEAFTKYLTVGRAELAFSIGKHSTSRYSLVKVMPETGRMHQIRKHFAHIHHPIIADRPHGCNKQNKYFKEKIGMTTMLLHASSLSFEHPVQKSIMEINAPFQDEFMRMLKLMGWDQKASL